jgi:hypothetical protein
MKLKLEHPIIGVMEFEKDHAARILAKEDNGGWVEYKKPVKAVKGGRKSDKGNIKKSEE